VRLSVRYPTYFAVRRKFLERTHNAAKLNNAGGVGINPDSAIPRQATTDVDTYRSRKHSLRPLRHYWLTFCGLILVEMPSIDDIIKAPLKTGTTFGAASSAIVPGRTGIARRRRPHRSPGDGAVSFLVRSAHSSTAKRRRLFDFSRCPI
jgi:hypothetical protein